MTLRPNDYDSNGDIIPSGWKEKKGDLISRKWLIDAIRNRRTYLSYEDAKDVIDLIDNAPTVEALKDITELHCDITKEQLLNSLRPKGGVDNG